MSGICIKDITGHKFTEQISFIETKTPENKQKSILFESWTLLLS